MPMSPNVAAAGPARALSSYPQYNHVAYQGMQPGALPALPGMGAPIQSYMPAVNGMNGFGGIPATQLVQALMSGYAGVPMATQPTGAQAPGMGTVTPTTGTGAGTGSGAGTNPYTPGSRLWRQWNRANTGNNWGTQASNPTSSATGSPDVPGYSWQGEGDGSSGTEGGGGGESAGTAGGAEMDGTGAGGMYARGGKVGKLSGPNPPGPDDGYAALDRGEYVVKASQAKKHGKTLARINAGKFGNKSV